MTDQAVPCKFCGIVTDKTYTRKCDACYDVDCRIEQFARSPAGRQRMREALEFGEAAQAQAQEAVDRLFTIAAQGLAKYEAAGWPALFKALQRRRTECCDAPVRVEYQGRYTMREVCEQCGRPYK